MSLKRNILHWTVGRYEQEFNDYHYLIDWDGRVIKKHDPMINDNCNDGEYCAHAKLMNTGSIGVGLMAMYGYKNKNNIGNYPITKKQFETACLLMAQLNKKYKFKENITHAEADRRLAPEKRDGKIDINILPYANIVGVEAVGNYMRNKINWYATHLIGSKDLT